MSSRFLKKKQGRKRTGKHNVTASSAKRASVNSSGNGWGDGIPLDKGLTNNQDTHLNALYEAVVDDKPEDEPTYKVYKDKPIMRCTVNPETTLIEENPVFREAMETRVIKWDDLESMEDTFRNNLEELSDEEFRRMYL